MDVTEYRARCEAVAHEFAAAYPAYVAAHIAVMLRDPAVLESTIGEAQRWLEAALTAWAGLPAREQGASPLELFREALAEPTAVAIAHGARPADRTGPEVASLPGDALGIAPATSRDIGEAAWHAHVAWGLARAEAIAGVVPRPAPAPAGATVALVGSNLMDRAQIEAAARSAGYELLLWRNPAAIADGIGKVLPALALVDLAHPVAMDAIRTLAASGVRTIAFGAHVDDHALAAAKSLGASDALPRSRFFRRLPQLLPQGA